jgi:hypothetical protein
MRLSAALAVFDCTYYDGEPRWPDHPDSVMYTSIQNLYSELYDDSRPAQSFLMNWRSAGSQEKTEAFKSVALGPDIENPGPPGETLILETVARPANVVLAFLERINELRPHTINGFIPQ